VSFTQRGVCECLARFDDAAGQRDLPAVAAKRIGADSQHEMRAIVGIRKYQYEARGVAYALGLHAWWPRTRGHRGHQFVGVASRQRFCERRNQFVREDGK
jgi:hypothetical protein